MSKVNDKFQALVEQFSARVEKLAKDKAEQAALREYVRATLVPEMVKLVKQAIRAREVG